MNEGRDLQSGHVGHSDSSRKVVGSGEGIDPAIAVGEQNPLEQTAAMVMHEIFKPMAFDKRRDQHDNTSIGIFRRNFENVLHQGNNNETIRGRDDREVRNIFSRIPEWRGDIALPVLVEQFGMFAKLDMDCKNVGRNARSKFQGALGDAAPAVHGDNRDGRLAVIGGRNGFGAGRRNRDGVIVMTYFAENQDEQRYENDCDPCPIDEFGNEYDQDGNSRDNAAKSVHERTFKPVVTAVLDPVHDHSKL